jgi:hypothetical protein
MKIVKVLLLDDAPWFLPDLEAQGVKIEVIQEGLWGTLSVYEARPKTLEIIKRLTENKEVDLIVVGNNMGAGVPKAMAIADAMKEQTIVVWNYYCKGDEAPYSAIGFKQFGSRTALERLVPALLGITV